MARLVREFVNVADFLSLDATIAALEHIRANLPAGAEAEVRMKGDDLFGRRLTVSFLRPQTAEELACEARYAGAFHPFSETATNSQDGSPLSLAA